MMMKPKPKTLTTSRVAFNNLTGKPGRTAALIAIVAIMAFVLFGGAVLSRSFDNGIRSLEARLGADMAVVPIDSEEYYENVVLIGSPANFFFHSNREMEVARIPGIQRVTTQLHIATLGDADCCTARAQVIGIDFDTDFTVTPWIAHFLHRQLGDGEVIVGNHVAINPDNTVMIFNKILNVAARLERTATGMDHIIYVNMDTAREIARIAQADGAFPADVNVNTAASAVLADVYPGSDINSISNLIRWSINDVGVVLSYGIYANVASNLRMFTGMINTVTVAVGIVAVLILMLLFSLITSGRKKEFAILRIMGATRKKLAGIVLSEALIISLIGAVVGVTLAAIIVFPFGRNIGEQMGMPLLLPSIADSAWFVGIALVIAIAVGPISSVYSAFMISRAETYATLREGE